MGRKIFSIFKNSICFCIKLYIKTHRYYIIGKIPKQNKKYLKNAQSSKNYISRLKMCQKK